MKRVITFIGCALLAWGAAAQSWQDALLYGANEYGGTARSVALGGAMTALGGDLGSLTFNPAGSSVAGYSQVAITGGLSYSLTVGQALPGTGSGFCNTVNANYLRAKMPNVGLVVNMDTGRRHGLKRMSFGIVSNSTADYTLRMRAAGLNPDNSYSGSLAYDSNLAGDPEYGLSSADWWDDAYADIPWTNMVAYRSGIYGMDEQGRYLGLSDWIKSNGEPALLGTLKQEYGFQSKGYKHDILLNYSLDFSDCFYIGANLGLVRLVYGEAEYWTEAPADESQFPDVPFADNPHARFHSLQMKRIFDSKASGAYFKLGMLWRPVAGLRLGAAIQTPTMFNFVTRSGYYGEADVTGVTLLPSQTPDYEGDYFSYSGPFRVNGGIAYSFGSVALLSVDYEGADYAGTLFLPRSEDSGYYSSNPYADVNADIRDAYRWGHLLRVGLEVKPVPFLALRAGYNLTASPLRDGSGQARHAFALGAGFSSGGSFYADFALRYRMTPAEAYRPYAYSQDNPVLQCAQVQFQHYLADALLTVGWRF